MRNFALPRAYCSFGERPADDVLLCFASTHFPEIETRRQQKFDGLAVVAAVECGQPFNSWQSNVTVTWRSFGPR
jgi:hypothetical protein